MLTRTASTVLARRTSSFTLRIRGRNSTDAQPKKFIGPRLPYEIIETVVGFVLPAYPCSESRFFALHSLIRASKMLREISLRLYFRNIVVDSWELFTKVWDYLSIQNEIFSGSNSFSWVRSFICPSHVVAGGLIKNIGSFVNLQVLKISFTLEGLSTQDSVVRRLLDSFSRSRTSIRKLTLTEIPRIDSKLLDSLSLTFPQLESLEMESSKRIDFDCCTVCLEDSLGYMRHSPIPDYYANAEKLAASFSRSLASLTKLKSLYIGLLLSDAYILEEHIIHSDETKGGKGILSSFSSCAACGVFKEETRRREQLISLALSKTLPSLTHIRWDTLFAPFKNTGLDTSEDKSCSSCDRSPFQIPSAITFLVHRYVDTGEVKEISLNRL